MESLEKQFEGLGKNLHKKMHQARGIWHNQKSITLSFLRCSEEDYGQSRYLRLVSVSGKLTAVSQWENQE